MWMFMWNNVLSADRNASSASCTIQLRSVLDAYAFIAMDLISEHKLLPQGHQYAFAVTSMLINYTWCILLFTKEVDKMVYAYLVHMYSRFCGPHTIVSDNGSQFKNTLFTQFASTIGIT